jgi:3-hydroxymyristoyl/3-hydroxydecanoyl-(acyl carrier protein) dehydratase
MSRLRKEIGRMLEIEQRPSGFGAVLQVDPNLSVFPDHFRDGPILPGICLVQAVLVAGAARQGVDELRIKNLKTLKLTKPVRPGQRVQIDAEMMPAGNGDFTIKAKLSVQDSRCAEISMIAEQELSAQ